MFAHIAMRFARLGRAMAASFKGIRWMPVTLLAVAVQACSGTPPAPGLGPDPSNPQTRVPSAAYRPVTGGYTSQQPVEPLPWRERNDRVAPQPKP